MRDPFPVKPRYRNIKKTTLLETRVKLVSLEGATAKTTHRSL